MQQSDITSVTFFGASVTEQSVHHVTKDRTGFVNYFEDELAEAHGFKVSRVSAGSSDVKDAGVVYVERVIEENPDICILDWVTPALQDCDPRFVQQIYFRLMEYDIFPVTVLLPRTDRNQRDIPLAREMARICERFSLPFYDVSEMLGDIRIDEILRDVVHTNAYGAEVYAKIMLKILKDTPRLAEPLPKPVPPLHVMTVEPEATPKLSAKRLSITVKQKAEAEKLAFSLVMEQRVGPYSPVLNIRVQQAPDGAFEQVDQFNVFDAWCHRERQCIKSISNWIEVDDMASIEVAVADHSPALAQKVAEEVVPAKDRHLKPRGDIYIVSDTLLLCSAAYA